MALRSQEKDRAKAQQEKFQAILSAMLKDEDNKYCEDCDAKGPRWASWNLGIFLCIRCAGIHRNLGVHISRVKSVNLDSWTAEQVVMMQEMGNSRARAVYEANVPDDFQRPQTNSAVEAFIRAKYENKKYIAREWVAPKPVVPKEYMIEWFEDDKTEKKKPRNKLVANASVSSGPSFSQSTASSAPSAESKARTTKPATPKPVEPKPTPSQPASASSGSEDLLGLDLSVNQMANTDLARSTGSGSQGGDLLADLFGDSPSVPVAQGTGTHPSSVTSQQNHSAEPNFFENGSNGNSGEQGEKKSTKDSIMALYGSGGIQQQIFGVPGLVPMSRAQDGEGRSHGAWTNNPFLCPEASFYQPCYVTSSPYYYCPGGLYMPQQQIFASGGMAPMMQQQQVMMGMQSGMMGQPMQQSMLGMQQPSGAMFGRMNQMGSSMMGGGQGVMVSGPRMMQQQPSQQTIAQYLRPMQQQMQLQQMQQQMASMTLGGRQMAGMQQPQQTAVGGGSWAGPGTGHTLSSSLWQ